LAAIVDPVSGGKRIATGECVQVGHHSVFKQRSVLIPACVERVTDHLAALIDPDSLAAVTTGERAEIPDDETLACGGLECGDREQGKNNQAAVNVVRIAN
jgi:hypothetical protein